MQPVKCVSLVLCCLDTMLWSYRVKLYLAVRKGFDVCVLCLCGTFVTLLFSSTRCLNPSLIT